MRKIINILIFFVLISPISLLSQTPTSEDSTHIEFIKTFVDYYKQAYEKKNLPFLEALFGEDALIITETLELKKAVEKTNKRIKKNRKYKTIIKNKTDYLAELKKYFANNNSIILDYSNLEVMKHNKYPEIYGISFLQYRKSSSSSSLEDQYMGFIMIMIDFLNEKEPVIHIRTWQPITNIKTESDKYNIYDFEVL